jgi:hypothetical protein
MDLTIVFTNILVYFYFSGYRLSDHLRLGSFYAEAASMAVFYGQSLPPLDDFLPLIFSQISSSENETDASNSYSPAVAQQLWDAFPAITYSIQNYVSVEGLSYYLSRVWSSMKVSFQEKGDSAEEIVLNFLKAPDWIRTEVVDVLYEIAECLYKDESNRDLSVYVFACIGFRLCQAKQEVALSRIILMFQEMTDEGKKFQTLINELLYCLSPYSWTLEDLNFARALKGVTIPIPDRVLIAKAYQSVKLGVSLRQECLKDIQDGLQEDFETWIGPLNHFLHRFGKSDRKIFHGWFYKILKSQLIAATNHGQDKYDDKLVHAFLKILKLNRNTISEEEWDLMISRKTDDVTRYKPMECMANVRELKLSEESIQKLSAEIFASHSSDIGWRLLFVVLLIRFMEISQDPPKYIDQLLSFLETPRGEFLFWSEYKNIGTCSLLLKAISKNDLVFPTDTYTIPVVKELICFLAAACTRFL